MNEGREKAEEERSAEDDFGVRRVNDTGRDFGVDDAKEERRNADEKTNERARRADIKEGAVGANGGTDEDESAKRADERGERNEEWIA